jgi:translation elongation factor EF-G
MMTGGQGSYAIEFLRYDAVPGNIQQDIIKNATLAEDEE